ncbi:LPD38 domain-containing protein [Gorillibacterium sp. sgz5001074]|uniref:LPD38 domain-containing protein n=1 Tax=Gorillibacterium sp. sgz5001074 TaxID=3446695 RepID=UPI003F680CEB
MDAFEKRRQQLLGSSSGDPFAKRRKQLQSMDTEQSEAAQMSKASKVASARAAEDAIKQSPMPRIEDTPLFQNAPKVAPSEQRKLKSVGGIVKEVAGSAVDGVKDALDGMKTFKDASQNAMSFGLTNKLLKSDEEVQQQKDSLSGKAGAFIGEFAPIGGAYKLAGSLTNGLVKNAPKLAQTIVRGATAGTLYGTAQEAADMALNPNGDPLTLTDLVLGKESNQKSIGDRVLNIGKDALTFAAGDAALGIAGPVLVKAVKGGLRAVDAGVAKLGKVTKEVGSGVKAATESLPTTGAVKGEETSKGSMYTALFGNQGVGAVAGGKTPRRSGTGMQLVDSPLKKDAQSKLDEFKEFGRAVKQDYVDQTAPLKHLGGEVQDIALDARRSNNIANTWIHDKVVTPEGVVVGPGLKDVIGSVPRGLADAFEDYLIVRHAKTRVARGERVYEEKLGMNDVSKLEVRQAELESRYPQFKELGQKWDEYNTNLLNAGEEFGLISSAQKKAMREENPNYASMRRQFSTAEKFSQPFAIKQNAFSGQKAPIKAVSPTGSARKIVSPVRTAIEQTGAWMNAGMRNRVMKSILDRVQAEPEALKGIVEIVQETSQATAKSLDDINKVLAKDGMEGLTEFLNQEYSVLFRKSSQAGAKTDNIVTVMVNGSPVKMRVQNPEIFKSLVGLAPEESNFVMDFFGFLSNATKRGATGALAPLFAAKSLTVDVAQALIQSKDPIRHVPDLLHATVSAIANKLPKNTPGFEKLRSLAQEFERTGGEYSAALRGDKPLNKAVDSLRKEPFLSPRGVWKGVKTSVATPFRVLEGVSDVAENVNRIAAYKGAMRRVGGERTPETVRNAMRESQEITTNFSRKGAKGNTIEKFIPYSNAAIQGLRRFGVQLRDNPVKTGLMVVGFVIAPKLWEQARFGDDPDYQKIPARTRYRNIIVGKREDGTFIQVPMPPEYQAIGALAADAMAELQGRDYVNWRDVSDALVNTYTPPFVSGALQGATQGGGVKKSGWGLANSTSAGPLIGTLANQSWTGAPIVSQEYATNSPYMQKDERTSAPSEWLAGTKIGQKLGLSPMEVDYLAKQYGGDLARLGLPLTSSVGGGTVENTLLKNFIVDPTFTNNLSRDYYDRVEQVKNISADVGDGAATPSWYNDNVKKLATGTAKGDPARKLRDLNAKKREIQGNVSLNAKQKAEQLRSVQTEINNLYLDVLSRLDAMGVPK